ncbi:hypothetical protein [Bacillus sp. NPDC094106]|uniref:hypothetical protein n=1 Tax=Bacillus sp. NPDC094106 TaxID=3363949 RepID=UPI00380E3923
MSYLNDSPKQVEYVTDSDVLKKIRELEASIKEMENTLGDKVGGFALEVDGKDRIEERKSALRIYWLEAEKRNILKNLKK